MSREDFELQAETLNSASAEWNSWVVLQEDNKQRVLHASEWL